MSYYRKPLARGGSVLIARAGDGRFARLSLGAEICAHEDCRAIILPEHISEGSFLAKRWPAVCHRCGRDWRSAGGEP